MLVKNINSTHRIEGISTQFGLGGALAASKVRLAAGKVLGAAGGIANTVKNVLTPE